LTSRIKLDRKHKELTVLPDVRTDSAQVIHKVFHSR
jgi:hypothetical protein